MYTIADAADVTLQPPKSRIAMQRVYQNLMRIRPAFVASLLKRILMIRRRVIVTDRGRFYIDPASNFGQGTMSGAGYEPDMTRVLEALLRPGDVFLDVGANEGYFSILASRLVGPNGRVICIEPQGRLQGVLFRNIAENGAYNVHVLQRAIADKEGMATLFLAPDMNTGSSGIFRATRYANPTELVPQVTLSGLLASLAPARIRLAKMDIEGFEYEAVLGAKDVFAGGLIENLALELHPALLERRGKSTDPILKLLDASGYRRNASYDTLIMSRPW